MPSVPIEFLLVASLKASLLCGATLLLLAASRRCSAAFRCGLIVAGAVGALLLPLTVGILPPILLSNLFGTAATKSFPLDDVVMMHGARAHELVGQSVDAEVLVSVGASRVASDPSWESWLAGMWCAGVIVGLLFFAARVVSMWRLRATSLRLPGSDALVREAQAAAVELNLRGSVAVRISTLLSAPFACGIGGPTILLPTGFGQLPVSERRAVFLHECAHLRRGDCLAQIILMLCRCLHWFNPLFLALDRAFNAEAEKACDDRVIAAGISPADYSETILHFCQTASALPAGGRWSGSASGYYPGALLDRRLRGRKRVVLARIRRIIDPAARRTALGALFGWLLFACASASASLLGALVFVPDYEWRYQIAERVLPHDESLIARWRMDRVVGGGEDGLFTPDSTGGKRDGFVVGAELDTEGRFAMALKFDGKDDHIDMGARFDELQFPITLTAWVRSSGNPDSASQNIVWLGGDERNESLYIGIRRGYPYVKSRSGATIISGRGDWKIDDGEWHHLAGVFVSENHRLLYADGELVSEDRRFAKRPDLAQLQVGRNGRQKQKTSFTKGSVDDVRVYRAALGSAEIRAVMGGEFGLVAARHEVVGR